VLNLRQFISELRKRNLIIDIHHEIDPHLELAEIHRRIVAVEGPALFFHNVKGSSFPVVTNLFGTIERVHIAFHNKPHETIAGIVKLVTQEFPPDLSLLWKRRSLLKKMGHIGTRKRRSGPILEKRMDPPDLNKLPMTKSWPLDGGDFLTLPLVYTEPVGEGPPNLGMYRVQRFNSRETGLHFQIAKGAGFHFHEAEKQNKPLPVNIILGGPPALIMSAIVPLPENVPEMLMVGLLQDKKLDVTHCLETTYPLISEAEFTLVGHAPPNVRRPEGPFGDHYGYYSWQHDFPLFKLDALYHRKDAIYPATVVGKPRQEDYYIGEYLQELLSPIFPIVMPSVKDLWSYGECGFHSLSAAVVKERFSRECMTAAFRILGEGQLSLTKFVMLTDQSVPLKDFKTLLETVLCRFRPETDLYIFSNLCYDTLDYTSPKLNHGSRGVLIGVGDPVRDLPKEYKGALPRGVTKAIPFCAGCLVLEGEFSDRLAELECFKQWPLLVFVDNVEETIATQTAFLWRVFTRFEPAQDIYCKESKVHRHHMMYTPPILIDARMKPSYPQELECDPETFEKVSKNWEKYFPGGIEQGSSFAAHT
jgi:4-hydroxybenzoate decarboxylase subunit C